VDEYKPLPHAGHKLGFVVAVREELLQDVVEPASRGLHSSTFRLNVSTLCGIRRVHDFPAVYETGGQGGVWPKRLRLS